MLGSVSSLLAAIDAEVCGDFAKAIEAYRGLAEGGPSLDRIGIYQALARCHEKLAKLADAAPWRRRAAQAYMALTDDVMPKEERRYYALVEARNAVQDLAARPEELKEVTEEYRHILAENWRAGPEGLTHEGLFGALFFRDHGDWVTAAKYFFDTAEAMNEQAFESSDGNMKHAALEAYELAEEAATKAGRPDVARVAALRATALRGGPRPQKIGGL
jgi:hypothetical protein